MIVKREMVKKIREKIVVSMRVRGTRVKRVVR